MMKFVFCLMIIAGSLVGCAGNQYDLEHQTDGFLNVSNSNKICVVTPQDGQFTYIIYHGSGTIVAEKIAVALRNKFYDVRIVQKQPNKDDLQVCQTTGANYAIIPNILHWEDRATGWSGKPDIVKINLKAIDLKSNNDSCDITFENKTNTLASAFIEWGNFKPQFLLDDKFNEAVLLLFP